jgi:hypothetical protein
MSGKRRAARRRRTPKQRLQPILVTLVVLALLGLGVVLFDHYGVASANGNWDDSLGLGAQPSAPAGASPTPSATPTPTPRPTKTVLALDIPFPRSGPGTYGYAAGSGDILGTAGPVRKFHVAIESNIKVVAMADFLAKVNETLGDDRSWIHGGQYRLQQVPENTPAEFTIYLVTSQTSQHLCAPLPTGGYTSCRQGPRVVLNLDRWMGSVTDYVKAKIPLETYRTYMVNHEVGHALGHSHQLCPGNGEPAPVMEQQTLGLHGCKANAWPYIDGKLYTGPSGRY